MKQVFTRGVERHPSPEVKQKLSCPARSLRCKPHATERDSLRRKAGQELTVVIPPGLTCGDLTVADFFSAGILAAFGLDVSRELLGFCTTEEGVFVVVLGLARVFKALLDFAAVTVCWHVLEVLASSLERTLASLGVLIFVQAEELFFR